MNEKNGMDSLGRLAVWAGVACAFYFAFVSETGKDGTVNLDMLNLNLRGTIFGVTLAVVGVGRVLYYSGLDRK